MMRKAISIRRRNSLRSHWGNLLGLLLPGAEFSEQMKVEAKEIEAGNSEVPACEHGYIGSRQKVFRFFIQHHRHDGGGANINTGTLDRFS